MDIYADFNKEEKTETKEIELKEEEQKEEDLLDKMSSSVKKSFKKMGTLINETGQKIDSLQIGEKISSGTTKALTATKEFYQESGVKDAVNVSGQVVSGWFSNINKFVNEKFFDKSEQTNEDTG